MGKKKSEPRPLFAVKHDFYESLDAYVEASFELYSVARKALELDAVAESAAGPMREAVERLCRAMSSSDG